MRRILTPMQVGAALAVLHWDDRLPEDVANYLVTLALHLRDHEIERRRTIREFPT